MSQLFGSTLRSAPAGVEAVGHQWLLRAGYVRQLGQGIFSYLPLGWRAMRRIETILREEMTAIGGVELSMPVVHPAELWQRSGRYHSVGAELTRLSDRRERPMVLAMTHEEVVATLAASEINSYRQLPKCVFQIQTKWRDDPRPRAGMVRAREFTMKDSYTLDADEAGLEAQYEAHYQAYFTIFERCGLPVIAVGSDTGMMGGTGAHEYMYLTPLGEDTLVICDHCGYAQNRQIATSAKPAAPAEEPEALERVYTPATPTIEALADFLGVPTARTAKAMFVAVEPERDQTDDQTAASALLVLAVLRGDTTLNEAKLAAVLAAQGLTNGAGELRPMTAEEISSTGAVPGFASPVGLEAKDVRRRAVVVADELVMSSPNLVAGANEADWHLRNTNAGRDYQPDVIGDIAAAEAGDACSVCGQQLRTERGVEVGNIFKLGSRYAAALGATYLDPNGDLKPIVMGSYGIGVGRLLACLAEEHHDERGLRLPVAVAPFQVHICVLGAGGSDGRAGGGEGAGGRAGGGEGSEGLTFSPMAVANDLYASLSAAGFDVLLDDRGERAGAQFADADLIGLPMRITVSPRSLAAGGAEVKRRDSDAITVVGVAEVVGFVSSELVEMAGTLPSHLS